MNTQINGTNITNGFKSHNAGLNWTNGATGAKSSKTYNGAQYENYFRDRKPRRHEFISASQRVLSKLSDEDLMILVVDGCDHAFNEIYRRYNRMVLYIASRSLDYTEAEDILQEIFFHTIIESGWRFNPEKSKFKSWLWTCTLHRVWRHLSYLEVRRRYHETAINLYRARGGQFEDFDDD
jgi:DNA-directed RNA polymerase specialized sigma24 family protein